MKQDSNSKPSNSKEESPLEGTGHLLRDAVNARVLAHSFKKGSPTHNTLKQLAIDEDTLTSLRAEASGFTVRDYKELNNMNEYE